MFVVWCHHPLIAKLQDDIAKGIVSCLKLIGVLQIWIATFVFLKLLLQKSQAAMLVVMGLEGDTVIA